LVLALPIVRSAALVIELGCYLAFQLCFCVNQLLLDCQPEVATSILDHFANYPSHLPFRSVSLHLGRSILE